MYKKHKWLSGLRNFRAFSQLRQICDLTGCFKILNLCLIANLSQYNLAGKSFEITYDFLYSTLYARQEKSCKIESRIFVSVENEI